MASSRLSSSSMVAVTSVVTLLSLLVVCSSAQQTNCSTAITSLTPCLSHITNMSRKPTPSCCTQLENLIITGPQCLCTVLNTSSAVSGLLFVAVDEAHVLAFSGNCNIQIPPLPECKNVIVGEPAASSPTAACKISPLAPSPQGVSSGISTKMSFLKVLFLVVLVFLHA